MNAPSFRDWKSVQTEVLRRIHAREWKPGELIPNEADLALEFGCARTTVNRALRAVAETGLLDRRRKAGSRVAAQPVAKATVNIAVIRTEIEELGQEYGYQRITRREGLPPLAISETLNLRDNRPFLNIRALHTANKAPYVIEDRWINTDVVPDALNESFETISANEWLLKHVPYTHSEIIFSATSASQGDARVLQCPTQSALFTIDRVTWDGGSLVTKVCLLYRPGHQIRTAL